MSTAAPDPAPPTASAPGYPPAERVDVVDDLHGRAVADPYRWLEDPADPRTLAWGAAQRALYEREAATWTARAGFAARVEQLLGAGVVSAPAWRGTRRFFMRREPGQQFAVLLVAGADGAERVLLDPMAVDPTGLTTLDAWQPSKEGDLLAYQTSTGGDEESELRVMDVATGEVVEGPFDRLRYTPVAWLPGGAAYYYVRRLHPDLVPATERQFHRRVYLHRVGADPDRDDVLVFGAGMVTTNYYGVGVSRDGRWLQVSASEGTEPRNDLWLADLAESPPEAPAFRLVQGDVDAQTGLHVGRDGRCYVSTDRGAPRGRVCVTDPQRPGAGHWADLLPEDPEAVLDGFVVLDGDGLERDLLLVTRTRHGVGELALHDAATGALVRRVPLPGAGTVAGPAERPEGGPEAWVVYTDHTTVPTVYRFDARDGSLAVDVRPPGVVDVPAVRSTQVVYRSADGTPVRMFVVAPADAVGPGDGAGGGDGGADRAAVRPDRPRPAVLYGYGGFGISLEPGYSASVLAWVEAGGVWAVANLRGGGEEGEDWHRAGMLGAKQNVFDDFAAAARYLVDEGWTTPGQLVVQGGSNGGLLVGAALAQFPELFGAAVCMAPLIDMVRYTTSQLGATWTVEYGDPAVPEQLDWLLGYSPYHRVRDGADYPATLVCVFDNDTRTDPMHGRKLVAALQHATAGTRPVLLRAGADVGHGARSLSRAVAETADVLAFAAARAGLEAPARWSAPAGAPAAGEAS